MEYTLSIKAKQRNKEGKTLIYCKIKEVSTFKKKRSGRQSQGGYLKSPGPPDLRTLSRCWRGTPADRPTGGALGLPATGWRELGGEARGPVQIEGLLGEGDCLGAREWRVCLMGEGY